MAKVKKNVENGVAKDGGAPSGPEWRLIDVDKIRASGTNPRTTWDEAALKELADNIKAVGIVQPLLVRPLPKIELREPDLTRKTWQFVIGGIVQTETGKYAEHLPRQLYEMEVNARNGAEFELVCGERRWRAAKLAKVANVPCVVRELTEAQVLEIQGVENLQRADLTAYEEAVWMKRLVDGAFQTPASLAQRLGKSRSHVFGRLALARASEPVLAALKEGRIEATVAQLIGTIPEVKQQEKVLTEVAGMTDLKTAWSFDVVKRHVEEKYRKDLKGAAFDRKDEELLAKVPSCEGCPKRSGNIEGYEGNNPNVCTDVACYQEKLGAHLKRMKQKWTAQGLKVLEGNIFDYSGEISMYSPFVSAQAKPEGKKKTYGELLEDSGAQAYVALDKAQKGHVVFRLSEVLPRLEKAGLKLSEQQQKRVEEQSPEGRRKAGERAEKELRERQVRRAAAEKAMVELEEKAGKRKVDAEFWRLLLGWLLHEEDADLKKMSEPELKGMFITQCVCQNSIDWEGNYGEELVDCCGFFGVNLGALEKEERKRVVEETRMPKDEEEFQVAAELLASAHAVSSADKIMEDKIRGVVEFRGRKWACTGGLHSAGGIENVSLQLLVPAAEWKGEPRTYSTAKKLPDGRITYDGIKVKCGKEEFVLSDPQITLVRKEEKR